MAVPVAIVGVVFLLVVGASLGLMAYIAHRGNKTSDFFAEAVGTTYTAADLSEEDIDGYYSFKDELIQKYAPEYPAQAEAVAAAEEAGEEVPPLERWTGQVPQEERTTLQKALMKRLVSGVGKLDQVQRDRPGNWKLWQTKLITEHFWSSLLESEKIVSQEIDECVAEAEELEPGWRSHIFQQAVHIYRMQKQQEHDKQAYEQNKKEKDSSEKMQKNNAEQAKTKAISEKRKEMEREVKRRQVEAQKTQEEKEKEEAAARKAMEDLLKEDEEDIKAAKGKKAAKKAPTSGDKSKQKKK